MRELIPKQAVHIKVSKAVRTIILLWLAWAVILISFQALATARFRPRLPDTVLYWTPSDTSPTSLSDRPYLLDPFMNEQVAWDSEFYLSIATTGYDDPLVRTAPPPWRPDVIHEPVSLNYAFFPFYPYVMRVVALPLKLLGLTPVATSTLAGVLVSLLGTLGAMLALYDLAREELEDAGGIRAAFYLIIFPTGFFLAQVYTEGLFVGLAFGSLALLRRQRWVWAALLAACATWTRAVGIALVIPLTVAWLREADLKHLTSKPFSWQLAGKGYLVLAPLIAYGIWRVFFGEQFDFVEDTFFGRHALQIAPSIAAWLGAFSPPAGDNPETVIYYGIEFTATLLATAACLATLSRYPGESLFGLLVILISFTSGIPQGMVRYVLPVPTLFIFTARLGRNAVFDRAWTLANALLMGLLAMLFAFDMWVA